MTKIILLQSVHKTGAAGDIVVVRPGYARNYLIPTGRAVRATKDRIDAVAANIAQIRWAEAEREDRARDLARELTKVTVPVVMAASSMGTLYGSVTPKLIAKEALSLGIRLAANEIHLISAIKTVGLHTVLVRLHAAVEVHLRILVGPSRAYIDSYGADGSTAAERHDRALSLLDTMAAALVGSEDIDLSSDLVLVAGLADADAGKAAEDAMKHHAGDEFASIVERAIRSLEVDCLVGVDAIRDVHDLGTVHFKARVVAAIPARVGRLQSIRLASVDALEKSRIELSLYSSTDLDFSEQIFAPVTMSDDLAGLEVSQTVAIPHYAHNKAQIWALASLNGECVHRRVWSF
jgi:large subunit ribosomal protein L9